jgi:biotin operon repressor
MTGLTWNDEAVILLEQYVREHTREDGEIDWTASPSFLPGRTSEEARSKWKYMRRQSGGQQNLIPPETDENQPSFQKLFEFIRDRPKSLKHISNHFGVSPKTVEDKISQMDEKGYRLTISREHYLITTSTVPQVNPPEISISDLMGKHFCIAVASDIHSGSRYAQPTSLNRFIKLAYQEFGVRHVFMPGDLSDGVFAYR